MNSEIICKDQRRRGEAKTRIVRGEDCGRIEAVRLRRHTHTESGCDSCMGCMMSNDGGAVHARAAKCTAVDEYYSIARCSPLHTPSVLSHCSRCLYPVSNKTNSQPDEGRSWMMLNGIRSSAWAFPADASPQFHPENRIRWRKCPQDRDLAMWRCGDEGAGAGRDGRDRAQRTPYLPAAAHVTRKLRCP